ncbi:sulfite exporter TauE/SafE family protein [Methylocapsa sp. D3K7]|uniref:urease accessory protein UreH domain-containing protein n=1 Tax=Methylocapsa sp. D3K7 TaxID=3041435 RepID=UPI00244ECB96|nr:sulfite exporter TauE/SafE family protein [Methylocapsa sp. D3K7]WGJ14537.1 sulfite exporter TauE/SafE family protein [Methylocapsa sp. D3K7]
MSTHRVNIHARGMHCSGCEHIIEDSVGKVVGVQHVKADYPTETVAVVFDPALTNVEDICAAIARKGYRCTLPADTEVPRNNFKKLGAAVLGILGVVFLIFLDTKWISQNGVPDVSQHMSLGLILVLGLLTGFHCVGMCGGFVLSYTAGDARLGQSSHLSHLLYGAGKTLSYTVIGALFGLLGAIVAFTPMLRGVAGVSAGIFLLIFGLNMLNIFPVLRKIRLKLPASLSWVLSGQQTRSRKRPFMIGLLNGLMIACGPLQAMYVMAAGTGSALEGAKMLFTFGIGTLPVLLSFGFLSSLISGALTHQLLRASGVILILLGAVMINRGLILTGAGYDLQSVMTSASSKLGWAESPPPTSPMVDHFQTITMDVIKSGFEPNHFVLRQGIPVKWVIDGKEVTECNRRIVVPKLGLEFDVKEGVQTIEFTPNETGLIPWSCWMGMLHGQFEVIAEPAITEKPPSVAGMDKPLPQPSGNMTARAPASTEEPSVQAKNAGIPEMYKVTAGDTLSKIARKRYGDATKWREVESANPGLNLKKLKSGQILYLPNLPANGSSKKSQ